MSRVKKISLKLGPLTKRGNDEYLPMQMTVVGDSIVWIDKELKKCKDNTFYYEFSYRDGNPQDVAPEPINKQKSAPSQPKSEKVKEDYPILHMENSTMEELVIAKPPYGPAIEEDCARTKGSRSTSNGKKQKLKVQKSLRHDDVISAIAVHGEWILTGCRGGTLHIWTMAGKHHLLIPGHRSSVEDVAWISANKESARFVSVSKDETTVIWEWNIPKNSVTSTRCMHERLGVYSWFDTITMNRDKTVMACGGWDAMVKFFSISVPEKDLSGAVMPERKTRTLLKMMKGHADVITGVVWPEENELITCSLDETIKLWEYESGTVKQEYNDQESFYTFDYSPLSRSLISATYDQIRMYDLRAGVGTLVKLFTHYKEPLRSVKWSTVDQNTFILGGGKMQVWDVRKTEAPLYELRSNVEEVLCCDWSNPKFMMFGGEDCVVRIYDSPPEILCNV